MHYFNAPPLPRGGGSVCRDGGVFAVIYVELLNNAEAGQRTLHSYAKATARMPSRSAIHLPLAREGAIYCKLQIPLTHQTAAKKRVG